MNRAVLNYLVYKFKAEFKYNNWMMDCPFCNDNKQRMGIHLVKGVTHCFHCDYAAPILDFLMAVEDTNLTGIYKILKKYVQMNQKYMPIRTANIGRNECKMDYIKIYGNNVSRPSVLLKMARKYLKNRGLFKKDIKFWKLGISKDNIYTGRIIIPFIENNKIVYFTARKFIGRGTKYLFPSKSKWGIGKAELLYNYEVACKFNELNIVEGVFDVYGTGKNSVAIMGKKLSKIQLSKIILSNFKSINIILDAGKEEALAAQEMAAILDEIIPTKIITLKKGDPGDRVSLSRVAKKRYSFREHLKSKIGNFKN